MILWLTLAVNSVALGGLLFLLSAGFSLIFGLMRIPNLMHGSFFMLGAYFGVTLLAVGANFWAAALASAVAMAIIGSGVERLLLRRLAGQELAQVLLTLGLSFIVSDLCLMIWTGDPWQPLAPAELRGVVRAGGMIFPLYRLAVVVIAVVIAVALWLMVDWTRLGAMIRAGVDDAPLALIVVILGGTGSLLGALVGSFLIGFLYNFGQARFPDLAYVILFLPMLLVLVLRPQGLFGKAGS